MKSRLPARRETPKRRAGSFSVHPVRHRVAIVKVIVYNPACFFHLHGFQAPEPSMVPFAFSVLVWCAVALVAVLLPADSFAKNRALITNIRTGMEGENLTLSFSLNDWLTPEMEEAIHSGVATSVHIRIILEQEGFVPFKPKIVNRTIEHSVKYDRLRDAYRVDLSGSPNRVRFTGQLDEAREWMSRVECMPLVSLRRLKSDHTYILRLKAELSKIQLPPFFRYLFFFVTLWDFETDWQKSKITF